MNLKILIRENLFYVNLEYWDRNTPSNSPQPPGTESKFGKERVHREVLSQSVRVMDGPCAPKFGEVLHEETRHQGRCARKAAWDLAKNIYKLKNSDKATIYVPGEAKVMSTPVASKRPEEREFAVDSGASVHMMSKKELSSGGMDVVKMSRTPPEVWTANGEVHSHEEAQAFVHDLNQFVTVQLLEETPAAVSPGKLCKDHGYSNE